MNLSFEPLDNSLMCKDPSWTLWAYEYFLGYF